MANVQMTASVDLTLYDFTFGGGKVGRLLRMYKTKSKAHHLELAVNKLNTFKDVKVVEHTIRIALEQLGEQKF